MFADDCSSRFCKDVTNEKNAQAVEAPFLRQEGRVESPSFTAIEMLSRRAARAGAVPKSLYPALLPPGEDARLLQGIHLPRNWSRHQRVCSYLKPREHPLRR